MRCRGWDTSPRRPEGKRRRPEGADAGAPNAAPAIRARRGRARPGSQLLGRAGPPRPRPVQPPVAQVTADVDEVSERRRDVANLCADGHVDPSVSSTGWNVGGPDGGSRRYAEHCRLGTRWPRRTFGRRHRGEREVSTQTAASRQEQRHVEGSTPADTLRAQAQDKRGCTAGAAKTRARWWSRRRSTTRARLPALDRDEGCY